MYTLAPNVDLIFTEAGPEIPDRIRAAAAAGFDHVEMWGTLDRDVDAIADALGETDVQLTSMIAEPRTNFTLPGTDLASFWAGLDRGLENARRLSAPRIVVGSGVGFPGASRQRNLERLIEVFSEAAKHAAGSGVTLVLEPVNTRVDHPGALLDRTAEAVAVARAVGSDSFGVLYDLYHSITEGEDPATEMANGGALIDYVQLADAPGRGEPGTGSVDWAAQLGILRASGYDGPIGLELSPTVESVAAMQQIRAIAADA